MVNKDRVIKNSLKFIPSNIFLRFFQIIQGIFVANILGPTLFGLKNAIQLISDYGQYIHFGTENSFYKERQITEYKKDVSQKDEITNLTFTFYFFSSFLFLFICLLLFFLLPYSITIRSSILVIGFLVPLTLFNSFFYTILQSKQEFKKLSILNVLQGIFVFLGVVVFTYFWGVFGFFLGALIGLIIPFFYSYFESKYRVHFLFNYKKMYYLIKTGIILFFLGLAYIVFFSIDRLFILFSYGQTELGFYAIGLFFGNLMYFLIRTIILPLVPNVYQNIDNNFLLSKLIITPLKMVRLILYWVVFILIYLIPLFVLLLPQYSSGVQYINILIFSMMFFPILINNYFIGRNKEKYLILISLIFILLGILFNSLVVVFNLSPIFVAYATLFTIFMYGNVVYLIGYKDLLGSWKLALKEVFNYLWPLGYALIGYGLLWLLAHYWLYDILNYYIVKVIQAVLFTIWYLPILWKIEKEHKILKMIWQGFKVKIKKEEPLTTIE